MNCVQVISILFATFAIFLLFFSLFILEMKKDILFLRKEIESLKDKFVPNDYIKNSKTLVVNELFIDFLDTLSHEEHTIHIIEDKCEKNENDEF